LVSVELESTAPISLFFPGRLIFLHEHAVFQNQDVHLGPHETAVGVLEGTDDRFARTLKLVTITAPVSF
jgi:hypothetical protein